MRKNKEQKTSRGILCLLFILPFIFLLGRGDLLRTETPDETFMRGQPAKEIENILVENMPYSQTLREGMLSVGYLAGQREHRDIYLTATRLLRKIPPPADEFATKNITSLALFTEENQGQSPPYLMILPTATGVLRRELPVNSQPVNERNVIDAVYNQLTGVLPTIDVYSTLLSHREEYIYYRTEDNLTPLGGYYVFEELTKRLLGENAPKRNEYTIRYTNHSFYGDLYQQVPYKPIEPDVLMQYHVPNSKTQYVITQLKNGTRRKFHTLYPNFMGENPSGYSLELDQYIGGLGERTLITSSSPESRSLLLITDKTALAYLPLLAPNYAEIMVLPLDSPQAVAGINHLSYTTIVIACSVDTFVNTEKVATVLTLLE